MEPLENIRVLYRGPFLSALKCIWWIQFAWHPVANAPFKRIAFGIAECLPALGQNPHDLHLRSASPESLIVQLRKRCSDLLSRKTIGAEREEPETLCQQIRRD
jgi:hypothetical protein